MESSIGLESSPMKSVKQASIELQEVINSINSKNILNVFNENLENISFINDYAFEDYLQNFNQRLRGIKNSFANLQFLYETL